jgi:hypothetical protein
VFVDKGVQEDEAFPTTPLLPPLARASQHRQLTLASALVVVGIDLMDKAGVHLNGSSVEFQAALTIVINSLLGWLFPQRRPRAKKAKTKQ